MKTPLDELFEARYKSLNTSQKQAVDTTDGPVMVVAGPGSGKTELLSLRVGKILQEGRAKASNILCLTFTETAATNMRKRLSTLIGADAYRVAIYTFHGFCTDVIGRYGEYFFEATHFKPASDLVQNEILESIFKQLPHKHVLGGYHSERGYAYLKESQARIKDIKKGGLTPKRFKEILNENRDALSKCNPILEKYLPDRVSKSSFDAFYELKDALEKTKTNLGQVYAKSIEHAIHDAEVSEKTTPLSAWKTAHTGKDESEHRVFKESLLEEKLYALCDIYEKYQEALYKGGYFDYEDMILQVVEALQKHVTLRTELEELYQYIMVDEFQDTNNAQLSLVKAISSNKVHEGKPNVCVVGDDDQAIYKFQGAEISNIHSFKELYKDVTTIVLTENYRSTQEILNFARSVVTQGVDRLETRYKEIRKDLVAKNTLLPEGGIHVGAFNGEQEEYAYIAKEFARLLQEGVDPQEIACIAREHKQLVNLLPYLDKLHIPYTYTRKENVFDEKHVIELITLCRFLATVGDIVEERDDLLPQILTFPFWGLDRITIWEIAVHAKQENISWLEAMKQSSHTHVTTLASFLIELGIASQTLPVEIILDTLIGSKDIHDVVEDEHDDMAEEYKPLILDTPYTSPYKEYYFGKHALKENPSNYISFLSSLKVFIHALRDYKEGEIVRVHDVGAFVDLHHEYNIPLTNDTPFAHNEHSISLLTSHGAKGLEFEYVFIISVHDSVWAGASKGSKLSFPMNLPLTQDRDNEDDFIRLFYVALTRARHTLYITHHKSPLRFLANVNHEHTKQVSETEYVPELLVEGLQIYHAPPFARDERALLQKVVEGYMLSPTHLNNFLNIIDGGPLLFLEQNLLRFPQAKTGSSVYGTAIHKAIELAHITFKSDGKVPKLASFIETFTKELKKGRLGNVEETKLHDRGVKVLTQYYEHLKDDVHATDLVELNFAKQGVLVDDALLTGKIDKVIEHNDTTWEVIDFKTGKGFEDWEDTSTPYDKVKLHHYRYQLLMYKLLVENSRDYRAHTVTEGVLSFVEEEHNGDVVKLLLDYETKGGKDELERVKNLASIVYKKIVTLDFPDTSKYEKTLEGIITFEDDLLGGRI